MSQQPAVYIALNEAQKKRVIFGAALIWFVNLFYMFAMPIAYPGILTSYGMMGFYAIFNALGSLISCLITPIGGKLGDKFGRRRIFMIAGPLRIAFLLACAFRTTGTVFIVLFMCSSVCGGLSNGLPQAILGDILSKEEKPKWFGIFGNIEGAAFLLGLLCGGLITDAFGALSIFLFVVPLLVIATVLILSGYPNKPAAEPKPLDKKGILWLGVALSGILAWCSLGDRLFARVSPLGFGILAVGIVFVFVLLKSEKSAASPIIDTRMFRNRNLAVSCITHLLVAPYMCLCSSALSVYGQMSLGVSATVAGTLAVPKNVLLCILPTFIGAWIAKDQDRNYRKAFMLCGIFTTVASILAATWNARTPLIYIYLVMVLFGIGTSYQAVCIYPYYQLSIRPEETGSANAIVSFSNSIGVVIFNAAYSILYNKHYEAAMQAGTKEALAGGIAKTFSVVAILTAISGVAIAAAAFFLCPKPGEKAAA